MCVRHGLDFDSRWGLPYASTAIVILMAAAWGCRVRALLIVVAVRACHVRAMLIFLLQLSYT